MEFAIVRMNAKGELRLYAPTPLKREDSIWVQEAGSGDDSMICCRRIKASEFRPVDEEGTIAVDKSTERALLGYIGAMPKDWRHTAFVGIATIGQNLRVKGEGTHLEVTGAAGKRLSVHLCTSREGVHLIQSAGAAAGASPHLYLWLGYDIEEPTCPPANK
ncbi:hypothetical protein [Roseateles chitosanitabidus]|uniref:hypothetical protein n=1 Tax=Roseateles chitosanitabidus TaxID=65048 RepID=UPI0023521908|nr:hypothetical protein [Roseateles chitosanitabidus]